MDIQSSHRTGTDLAMFALMFFALIFAAAGVILLSLKTAIIAGAAAGLPLIYFFIRYGAEE